MKKIGKRETFFFPPPVFSLFLFSSLSLSLSLSLALSLFFPFPPPTNRKTTASREVPLASSTRTSTGCVLKKDITRIKKEPLKKEKKKKK